MGDTFDIEFPLHQETGDAVRVGQILTALLSAIDRDISIAGETSNGDVLQAVAMALAIRARMIQAPVEVTERLSSELLQGALTAVADAKHEQPQTGHA